jgi:F-type H+-transporting ATPase subunit delta
MLAPEVAQKYGSALFMSVKEKNLLDKADEQFLALKELLAKDRSLLDFLNAPQVPDDQKLALIHRIFDSRMERPFVEFLLVLLDKHRINFLSEIVDQFDRLVKAEKGIAKVTVITAVPMSSGEEQGLMSTLAKKTGLKIELDRRVDPAIIGGAIIIMHDRIIDGSVRHGLNLIEEQLEKVKVA